MNRLSIKSRIPALFLIFFLIGIGAFAQTIGDYRSKATGNWSALTTWERINSLTPTNWAEPTVAQGYPGQNAVPGVVTIQDNNAVILDVSPVNNIGSLAIANGANVSTLTVSGTNGLIISGTITIGQATTNIAKSLLIDAGTITCAEINLVAPSNGGNTSRKAEIRLSTGTITTSGNINFNNDTRCNITFTSNGTLNIGSTGTLTSGGTLTSSTGTVNYNGTGQLVGNYNYHNLTLSGSGTKTWNLSADRSVGGNLTVNSGTTFNIGGTSSPTFTGAVTINPGGVWANTNTPTSFGGGITMNGASFNNGTGTATFSTSQVLQGSSDMIFGGGVIISGATNTLGNLNTASVTMGNVTGNLSQGPNARLILTGTAPSGLLSASTIPNTVIYGAGGNQTIKNTTYYNLELAGTGTKTFPNPSPNPSMNITQNLSISSGVVASLATGVITYSAATLTLNGAGQLSGTWGGTGSGADYPNPTYFAATTGRINIGVNCVSIPSISGLSASANNSCSGIGVPVTIGSDFLTTGTYTIRYQVSGANVISSTSTTLSFDASTKTGTFTTAVLPNSGASNTVTITEIRTSSGCRATVAVPTGAFSTASLPPTITLSSTAAADVCFSSNPQNTTLSYTATSGGPTSYSIVFNSAAKTQGFTDINQGLPLSPFNITVPGNAAPGTYSGTLTVSNGSCLSTPYAFTVKVVQPSITFPGAGVAVCQNAAAQTANLIYTSTTESPNKYSIDFLGALGFSNIVDANLPVSPIIISVPAGTTAGNYSANLTVKNASNCVSSVYPIVITVIPSIPSNPISSATASNTCPGNGITVTINSATLSSGTYTVVYNLISSGGGGVNLPGELATMTFNQSTKSGTFITKPAGTGSPATVTITSIRVGVAPNECSVPITSNGVISNIVNSTLAIGGGTTFTITGSTTDIGNPNGSTINVDVKGSGIPIGTYTVNYSITGPVNVNGSADLTLTASRKSRLFGSFITGQLSVPGIYTITVTTIASKLSPTCNLTVGSSTTFQIQSALVTLTTGNYDNGPTVWGSFGVGPDFQSGTVTISKDHIITYDGTGGSDRLILDQLVIYGTLIISTDQILEIVNGTGMDLTIGTNPDGTTGKIIFQPLQTSPTILPGGTLWFSGDVTHQGTIGGPTTASPTNIIFDNGSVYSHRATATAGSPPNAYWHPTSTFTVEGYTSYSDVFDSNITGWSQNFGNVVWNCPLQTGDINLNGKLGSGSIQGNLTLLSTGSGIIRFAYEAPNGNGTTAYSLSLPTTTTGDFTVSGSSRFAAGPASGKGPMVTLTMRDFNYASTASTPTSWIADAGKSTFNVRNLEVTSGTLFCSDKIGNATTSGSTLNVTGNLLVQSGATLDGSSSNTAKRVALNFKANASNSHTLTTTGGTIDGNIDYTIDPSQIVRAVEESAFYSNPTGLGTFVLSTNARLIVESQNINGAIQSGTTAGNLRVPDAGRNFAANSAIEYNRTVPQAQYISGTGHPSSVGVNCFINNSHSNGVTVTSAGTVTIGGDLTISSGNLNVSNSNLTIQQTTNVIGGNLEFNTSSFDALEPLQNPQRTITFSGVLNMAGGQVNVTSGAFNGSNAILNINGGFSGNNSLNFLGKNCRVSVGVASLPSPASPLAITLPINKETTLEDLTINRPGATLTVDQKLNLGNNPDNQDNSGLTLDNGNLRMLADLVVTTRTTLNSGILYFDGRTVTLERNINTAFPAGVFSSNAESTLNITTNFGGVNNTLAFSPLGNTLGILNLNRSANVTQHVTLNSDLTISNELRLTDGEFYNQSGLSMGVGATIIRTPDAAFTATSQAPLGGAYHVIYNDGAGTSLNTGVELQDILGRINDVTTNLSGTATLKSNLTGIGTLTVNRGVFTCDIYPVNMANASILLAPGPSTLNAPSGTNLTLTGNFTNNGTFNSGSGTSTVVFNGISTIGGSQVTSFNHLTLNPKVDATNRILTAPSAPSVTKMEVKGDINFGSNSLFNHVKGNVELTGSLDQSITSNHFVSDQNLSMTDLSAQGTMHFYTITVNKTGASKVLLQTPLQLGHLLDFKTPTEFVSNGRLILLSQNKSVALDARIGPIVGPAAIGDGATITGDVQTQRFMGSIRHALHRYIASPVNNGAKPTGVVDKLLYWVGDGSGGNTGTWLGSGGPMPTGEGYAALSYSPSDARWSVTGNVKVGSFTWGPSKLKFGWNLVGNPYPAAVRWESLVDWNLNNVSTYIGITDNNISGYPNYFHYISISGQTFGNQTPIENSVIAMGQAFWVYAGTGGGTLTINESAKLKDTDIEDANKPGQFYRESTTNMEEELVLNINNGKFGDQSVLRIDADNKRRAQLESNLPKLWNPAMNIYLLDTKKTEMLTYTLKDMQDGMKIPVGIKVSEPGDYEVSFNITDTFGYSLYLIDLLEGEAIPVSADQLYKVTIKDASKPVNDRFYLSLNSDINWSAESFINVYPNPVKNTLNVQAMGLKENVAATLMDVNGKVLVSSDFKGDGSIDMANYPEGMYILKIKTTKGITTRKIVKQ